MHRDQRPNVKNVLPQLYVHTLALLTVLLLLPAAAHAQWTTPDASGNVSSTNTGNVGIGTASPTSKLDVTGSAAVSGDLKVGAARLKFTFSGPEGQVQGATERLSFWTPNSSAAQTMRMRIGGNSSSYVEFLNVNSVYLSGTSAKFGVGTSNPTSKFHLVSGTDSGTTMLHMDTGLHGGTAFAVGGTANNESTLEMSVYRAGQYFSRLGVNQSGHVYLQPGGGNVGVGISTPLTVFHVLTTGSTKPQFILQNSTVTTQIETSLVGNSAQWNYGMDQADGSKFKFSTDGSGDLAAGVTMTLTTGGNVGIGTTSPGAAYRLDVAGAVRSSSGGFVFPDGTTQATAASPVTFGSSAGTAVQGNTTLTVTAGAGMSGGGTATLGSGGTLTLANDDRGSAQNIFKNVGNAAGATQFSAGSNADTLRFEGAGGTTVSFDANSRKVVINSASASSSGWTDSGASVSVTSAAAKVGMGTSSPSAGLDVQTPVTAATAYGTRLQQTITAGANNGVMTGLYVNPTFSDGVAVGNTHNALATGAGNVGIGTTATGAGLDVQNAGVASGSASYGARFKQTIPAANNNADSTALYIEPTFADGAAVGVRHNGLVVASGNVGIGTASPSYKLHVSQGSIGVQNAGGDAVVVTTSGAASESLTSGWSSSGFGYVQGGVWGGAVKSLVLQGGGGNVGIGTTTPAAKLDVSGGYLHVSGVCGGAVPNAQGTYLSWNQNCGNGETDLINHQGLGGGGFAFMNTANGSALTTLMSISGDGKVGIGKSNPTAALDVVGNIKATGSVSATYQDVAEWVPSTQKLSAGTVVVLDGGKTNHVLASTKSYDTKVAGVVSAEPGVILGVGGEGKLKVATTGRVKVKVDARRAPIEVGDLLVTGEMEGVAMKSVEVDLGDVKIHRPGTIIGKALEPLASGTGEILVLLSLQ